MPVCRVMLACVAMMLAAGAQAACIKNRVALLPVTLWQNKLFVPVTVNGVAESFFVDTGAATTTLSDSVAGALNIPRDFDHTMDAFGVGGQESHLYIGQVDDFNVGGIDVRKRSFPVAAFGVFKLADGRSQAAGLIGADILSHFDVDIDIPHRQIGLWRVDGCSEVTPDWLGESAGVKIQIEPSKHITVPVRIDGAALDLVLDTGAPDLLLTTLAAARAGATPEVLDESRRFTGYGVNDRSYEAWLHIFRRVEIGPQVYGDVRAVVVNRGRYGNLGDGLLGVEFLKRRRVWISYSTRTFFTQPAGG
jgi:clan AA aspartic protease (TIGR02281 family)